MFTPDGYLKLYQILKVCDDLAYDRFPLIFKDGSFDMVPDIRPSLYKILMFDRFLDEHSQEMWIFQYPNILLRASSQLFHRTHQYDGPCPQEQGEAKDALEHLEKGRMVFLNDRMRINAEGNPEIWTYELDKIWCEELKPVNGAIICWKPESWPVDLERTIWRYRDEEYFKGHPVYSSLLGERNESVALRAVYDAFKEVCPEGKDASGFTWSEIEKRSGWSRRHIRRAVQLHGGQEHGQDGGQGMGN